MERPKRETIEQVINGINFSRAIPTDYINLIQEVSENHTITYDPLMSITSAGWECILRDPEQKNFFEEHLKGQILIDLGGGVRSNLMTKLTQEIKVETYINVDIGFDFLKNKQFGLPMSMETVNGITKVKIGGDMLDFVSRIQYANKGIGINFTINNIDECNINNFEYFTALADEIVRILKPENIIFGFASPMFFALLNARNELQKVTLFQKHRNFHVFKA
jgi:hypothetical protein